MKNNDKILIFFMLILMSIGSYLILIEIDNKIENYNKESIIKIEMIELNLKKLELKMQDLENKNNELNKKLESKKEVSRELDFRCEYKDLLIKYFGKNALLMHRIMVAESNCNPNAKNKSSSASGLFQIIKSTWESNSSYEWEDRFNPEKNIYTASIIFQRRGTQPWISSKKGWK